MIKLSIQGRNKKKNVDLFKKAFVMQGCSIKLSAGDKQGYNMKSCKCIKKSRFNVWYYIKPLHDI